MEDDGPKNGRFHVLRTVDKKLYAEPPKSELSQEQTAGFNEGCQARLDGVAYEDCPYNSANRKWRMWREGWMDVEHNWGRNVGGRWGYGGLKKCR